MTVIEYKSQVKKHEHAMAIGALFPLAAILVPIVVALTVRTVNEPVASFLAPVFLLFLGLPLMLYGFWRVDRMYKRYPMLICTHCSGSLARAKSTVIATGNCPNCGRRVLDDETIGT